ncbi:MAG: glycosyltransferase family 4 protein [Flavobacterium sp.]|nr:glycosyltransferase family 4 protein [Flavobacterium sp.]
MKILFLTDQMYLHGGIERILSQKINYLIDFYQQDVYLITTEQKNQISVYELDKSLIWKDLSINYHREISYFHPKNLIKIFSHFKKLKRFIKLIQPDLIISVSTSPEQYFLPFICRNIPKIKEFHSSRFNYQKNKNWKQKLDKAFEFYDELIVLNSDEAKYYTNKNITIIPNFTDFQLFNNKLIAKQKTIIAAGRIAPVKQFDELIKIWKMIHIDFPDWKVKIFGNGEPKIIQELKLLIADLNLADSVFLLPATNNIQEEMLQASVYAMTSSTECFPMVLLEAQACSLPILSYDCPNGPRNIITENSDGFLIEPQNKLLFTQKLSDLINSENMIHLMGNNAQKNISKFKKEIVMLQWKELFNKFNKI